MFNPWALFYFVLLLLFYCLFSSFSELVFVLFAFLSHRPPISSFHFPSSLFTFVLRFVVVDQHDVVHRSKMCVFASFCRSHGIWKITSIVLILFPVCSVVVLFIRNKQYWKKLLTNRNLCYLSQHRCSPLYFLYEPSFYGLIFCVHKIIFICVFSSCTVAASALFA